MPLYRYRCDSCGATRRRICPVARAGEAPTCCEAPMARQATGASSQAVETLDNGVMSRSITRLVDAERLFHDRAEATKKMSE